MAAVVFAVICGENHEGYGVVKVYAQKDRAIEFAREYITERTWCKWEYDEDDETWSNGCDYVSVVEFTVN